MGAFDEEWHKKTPLNTENIIFFARKEIKKHHLRRQLTSN